MRVHRRFLRQRHHAAGRKIRAGGISREDEEASNVAVIDDDDWPQSNLAWGSWGLGTSFPLFFAILARIHPSLLGKVLSFLSFVLLASQLLPPFFPQLGFACLLFCKLGAARFLELSLLLTLSLSLFLRPSLSRSLSPLTQF